MTHVVEVGGSIPSPRTSLLDQARSWIRGEPMGLEECPYMRRWVADFGPLAVRLHRWERSDDARAFHDHAWWFLTLVLRGSYADESPAGRDVLTAGSVRYRSSSHKHTVQVLRPGTWTLLVTGRPVRRWGFWVRGKLVMRDKYFATTGHHPCDPSGAPVRRRPDGSRI